MHELGISTTCGEWRSRAELCTEDDGTTRSRSVEDDRAGLGLSERWRFTVYAAERSGERDDLKDIDDVGCDMLGERKMEWRKGGR